MGNQKQRSSRCFTAQTAQSTEIVNTRKASADLNTRSNTRFTGKSAVRSTTKSAKPAVSQIYNTICNQIYSDNDGQEEETASSGLYHSYSLQDQLSNTRQKRNHGNGTDTGDETGETDTG